MTNAHPPDAEAASTPPPPPLWVPASLLLCGTLGMHIFIPALPSAGAEFGVGMVTIQMTVTVYIAGLALGQLVYGPLSDHFGRRPVLLAGLALFTAASLAAAFAPNASTLIAIRLVQALGGCAGLVLGRAIVRDTAGPVEAARRLALMNVVVVGGPALAPNIGGALAVGVGWRFIFVALAAIGLYGALVAWFKAPRIRPARAAGGVRTLARNYGRLLLSPVFICYAFGGGCATTAMYAFVAAAPFIFIEQLHRPTYEVGIYLALSLVGAWLGSAIASRLIGRVEMRRILIASNLIGLISALALLLLTLTGQITAAIIVSLVVLVTIGCGVAGPLALTLSMSVNPQVIGSASGLYGFAQMAVGAICTALVGIGDDPMLATAVILAGAGAIAQTSFWIALRRA